MSEWVGGYKGGYVGNRARHTNYRASESPHSCEPSCPHHKGRTALVWSCPAGYMGVAACSAGSSSGLECCLHRWKAGLRARSQGAGMRLREAHFPRTASTSPPLSGFLHPPAWLSPAPGTGAPQGAVGVCCHLQVAPGTASSCPAGGALPAFL